MRRYRFLLILLVLPIILVSFVITYVRFDAINPFGDGSEEGGNKGVGVNGGVPKGGSPFVVEFRAVFRECGHEELIREEVIPGSTGLTSEGLSRKYPGWTLKAFSEGRAVFIRTEEGLCKEDRTYKHIGIKDGYVTIFYGRPRPDALVMKSTRINVKYLPPSEVRNLEKGIVVRDDAELLQILEGLSSLQPF